MTRRLTGAALAFACVVASSTVQARPYLASHCVYTNSGRTICQDSFQRTRGLPKGSFHDPRPLAWCGWWMRHYLGVKDRAGNRAIWWARYGSRSHGPAVGAIVVWPHHVGIITGRNSDGWVIKSGNDGHRVRERARSLRGAIAFRWPTQIANR